MSKHTFDLDLTRPANSGVYFVAANDLERLSRTARREELQVCLVDLAGCANKDELLSCVATSLQFPAPFGDNWDALADCLRDLSWMPAWGYVLLINHADDLRQHAEADYDILLGILDDASTFGCDQDMPWFAFLAMPDDAFETRNAPAQGMAS